MYIFAEAKGFSTTIEKEDTGPFHSIKTTLPVASNGLGFI